MCRPISILAVRFLKNSVIHWMISEPKPSKDKALYYLQICSRASSKSNPWSKTSLWSRFKSGNHSIKARNWASHVPAVPADKVDDQHSGTVYPSLMDRRSTIVFDWLWWRAQTQQQAAQGRDHVGYTSLLIYGPPQWMQWHSVLSPLLFKSCYCFRTYLFTNYMVQAYKLSSFNWV